MRTFIQFLMENFGDRHKLYNGILLPNGRHEPLLNNESHTHAVQRLGLGNNTDDAMIRYGAARVGYGSKILAISTRYDKIPIAKRWIDENVDPRHVETALIESYDENGKFLKSHDHRIEEGAILRTFGKNISLGAN